MSVQQIFCYEKGHVGIGKIWWFLNLKITTVASDVVEE